MGKPVKLKDRYEIKGALGQGGMGVVYRAYDQVLKCDVAVKTIRDMPDRTALQLFNRECEVLAALNHPNIVKIFDIGEFDEDGNPKPYFVMPLLQGATLDRIIRDASSRLTTERSVEIMSQTCRGLQAAHENGLVHRDLKPSNIFVMRDDTVEIIDFGVAHMVSRGTATKQVGTLAYMAPEVLEMKQPSALSDIFALGVIAYELFTRHRPFQGATEQELVQAILHEIPPPATDLNPAVPAMISRVIHKALAKQPWHRFASAREFAETLQKALRGEPIESFDAARIQPRVDRARKAFEQGDHQFAGEILAELQAEGHLDPDIVILRRKIEVAERQKRIHLLLESARTRLDEEEYPLALQKVQEIVQLDPDNAEALGLKARIEGARSERQIEDWFRLARQHTANQAFDHAREALQNVLQLRPRDTRALSFVADIDRQEQEYLRIKQEREQLYRAAVEAYQEGELSSALTKLERILEMERNAASSATPERGTTYRNFYNQVRTEYDGIRAAYAEARAYLEKREFVRTLAICEENLTKHPGHALFQALKFDAEEQQRQQRSSYIADIDRRVDAEADLQQRVNILKEAVARCPEEPHFQRALQLTTNRLELVNSIVAKARHLEERGQFSEAIGQWEILRAIHGRYPGLEFEIERTAKRREQQARSASRARWVEQFDQHQAAGEYERALQVLNAAEAEFPNDAELESLEQLARQGLERTGEAEALLDRGRQLCAQGIAEEGLEALRKARALDERNTSIHAALLAALVEIGCARVDTDWRAAEALIKQALELDPQHPAAKSALALIEDRNREEFVGQAIADARRLQAAREPLKALAQVEQALAIYSSEPRLVQLHSTLKKAILDTERWEKRRRDLHEVRGLAQSAESASTGELKSILAQARGIAREYPGDLEFESCLEPVERRIESLETVLYPAAMPAAAAAGNPAPPAVPELPFPLPAEPETLILPPPPPHVAAPLVTATDRHPNALRNRYAVGAAGLLILLLAGIGWWGTKKPTRSPFPTIAVEVQTNPAGAELKIAGKSYGLSNRQLQLLPGSYDLEIVKDGYQPDFERVTVASGKPVPPVNVALRPVPARLEISTDLKAGRVALDGGAASELLGGQFALETVMPGKHSLSLESGHSRVTLDFEYSPGLPPVFAPPAVSEDLNVVLVAAGGSRGRLWASAAPVKAFLNGQPAGDLGPEGLDLPNLPGAAADLALGEGDKQWKRSIDPRVPGIQAFIASGANVGTLTVQVSGADQVDVSVDGLKRGATRRHGLFSMNLAPGDHEIEVSKPGFMRVSPKPAAIRKGAAATVAFAMVPLPEAPVAAQPVESAVDGQLEGSLRVDVSPANATVTYTVAGETGPHEFPAPSVRLPEGSYTVTARAPGFSEGSETVRVMAGPPATVVLHLSPVAAPVSPVHQMNAADWDKPWAKEDDWFVRDETGPVIYRITPVFGTFHFALRPKDSAAPWANPHVQWMLNYKDNRNYVLFEIDKKSYSRTVVADGAKKVAKKLPHDWKESVRILELVVEPAAVTVKLSHDDGKTYQVIDTWQPPGNVGAGRFGFYVSKNERLLLANFSFVAK
jgi:serine/threonine-protein kinase